MQRITITIEDDLLALVDGLAVKGGYTNRSEAMLDLLRAGIRHTAMLDAGAACVGVAELRVRP